MSADSILDTTAELATEQVVDLSEFADEPGGAWPKGWYTAEILEGYQTRKGKVFTTADEPSQRGDSRNLRIALKVQKSGADDRTMQTSLNYRTSDFGADRLAFIKEARVEFKDVKGKWADSDAQRSSLAIAKLGSLGKAVGFSLKLTHAGFVDPTPFIGQKLEVYLSVGDNGYNEVKNFKALTR